MWFKYVAPEVQQKKMGSILSDMYSLGMVIWSVFNKGRPLIQANHNVSDYLKQIETVSQRFNFHRFRTFNSTRILFHYRNYTSFNFIQILCGLSISFIRKKERRLDFYVLPEGWKVYWYCLRGCKFNIDRSETFDGLFSSRFDHTWMVTRNFFYFEVSKFD